MPNAIRCAWRNDFLTASFLPARDVRDGFLGPLGDLPDLMFGERPGGLGLRDPGPLPLCGCVMLRYLWCGTGDWGFGIFIGFGITGLVMIFGGFTGCSDILLFTPFRTNTSAGLSLFAAARMSHQALLGRDDVVVRLAISLLTFLVGLAVPRR